MSLITRVMDRVMDRVVNHIRTVATGILLSLAVAQVAPGQSLHPKAPNIGGDVSISVSPSASSINVGSNTTGTLTFYAQNNGTASGSISFSATCSGAISSCSVSLSNSVMAAGATRGIDVTFHTGLTGTGNISFDAKWTLNNDANALASVILPNAPPIVSASLNPQWTQENVSTGNPTFSVKNNGNTAAVYSLSATCSGNVFACSVAGSTSSIAPGASQTVQVYDSTGTATNGNGTLHLTATSPYGEVATSPSVTVVPMSEDVSVTTSAGTTNVNPGSTPTQPFTITAVGNNTSPVPYTLVTSCIGTITCSSSPSPAADTISPGHPGTSSITMQATTSPAGGNGVVQLTASYTTPWGRVYSSATTKVIHVNDTRSYGVSVTPDAATDYSEQDVATNYPHFIVSDTGNTAATYTLTIPTCTGTKAGTGGCTFAGGATSTTVPVAAHSSATVFVYFHTDVVGVNTGVTLHAVGPTNSDNGSVTLYTLSPKVSVSVLQNTYAPINSTSSAAFHVHNIGTSGPVTYHLVTTGCASPLTNCSPPDSVRVAQGADSVVNVSFTTNATPGSSTIWLRAYTLGFANLYQDSAATAVVTSGSLVVDGSFNNNDNQNVGLCAASCFAMTTARSTVPYYTLDTPRSVSLVYNGDRAFPRPFVYADVRMISPPSTVQTYKMEVLKGGTNLTFTNNETALIFSAPADPTMKYRLAGQIDMSSYSTGIYPVQLRVTANYANGTHEANTTSMSLLVVNTAQSGVAKGWTVAGVPKLTADTSGSVVMTDGTGSALLFAWNRYIGSFTAPPGDFTTLTAITGGWVRKSADSTKVWFGATGLADSVTDRLGFTTKFVYDGSSRLIKIYDPMLSKTVVSTKAATTLTYNSTYGLQSIQEPNPVASSGRTTLFRVGSDSLLHSVVDPSGTDSTTYGYDGNKRLGTITDNYGHTVTYSYGTSWKLSQVTAPAVPIDAGGGSTTLQSPVMQFQPWQSIGVPTSATASAPATPVRPDTMFARITDANGYVSKMTVNRFGQADTTVNAVGDVAHNYYYYGNTLLTSSDDIAGISRYAYSGPFLLASSPAGSDSVNYHYGAMAQMDSVWGPSMTPERLYLKADGRADSVRIANDPNRTTRYVYDSQTKRAASVSDPAGHTTSYTYDATFGNLVTTVSPGSRTYSRTLDAYGRDSADVAPGVGKHIAILDVLNRPVLDSIVGNTGATHFAYRKDSVSVTDAIGQVYTSVYNALGWKVADRHPDSALPAITSRYDKMGRVTSMTNRRGQTVTATYDALGRVHTSTDPVSGTSTFTYSSGGYTTVASNQFFADTTTVELQCQTSSGTYSTQCSSNTTVEVFGGKSYVVGAKSAASLSDTASEDDGLFHHKVARNTVGQAASVVLGPLSMNYSYDALDGLLTGITLPNGSTQSMAYTTNNEVYNTTFSDSLTNAFYRHAQRYDSLGRLTSEQRGFPSSPSESQLQLDRKVAYDSMGRVSRMDLIAQGFGGTYGNVAWPDATTTDSLNVNQGWRYISSGSYPFQSMSYTYDAVGNRRDQGNAYHTGNRLYSDNNWTYQYDADGNLSTRTSSDGTVTDSLYWDASGKLLSATVNNGYPLHVTFEYDPYGRLAWRSSVQGATSHTRLYVYQDDNITKEVDLTSGPTNGQVTEYEYADVDQPIMGVTSDSVGNVLAKHVYMMDAMGNVIGSTMSDSTSSPLAYDAWGAALFIPTRLSTQRFGFKGMLYDEDLGIYYARARWYDPQAGRFISEDPIGLGGGVNQYVFAGNDPINGSDPSGMYQCLASGLDPCDATGGGGGCETYSDITITHITINGVTSNIIDIDRTYQECPHGNGEGSGGGQARQPKPKAPDVKKHYGLTMSCGASASQVMGAVESNFSQFGNYSVGPLSVSFSPPAGMSAGSTIPITVGTFGFTLNMGVSVASMSARSMTFNTLPGGHLFYPGSVTFTASPSSAGSINFSINLSGTFNGATNAAKYYAGGALFENAQWNHFLEQVNAFCKASH